MADLVAHASSPADIEAAVLDEVRQATGAAAVTVCDGLGDGADDVLALAALITVTTLSARAAEPVDLLLVLSSDVSRSQYSTVAV